MLLIAKTPTPPIFTSHRTEGDNGYGKMADRMVKLASEQEGFLGVESAREDVGITVSYWSELEFIKNWKANLEHQEARRLGHKKWYSGFKVRIANVEHDYGIYIKAPLINKAPVESYCIYQRSLNSLFFLLP